MRFLVYLVTILLFGTAAAQNPVIVQGNYITNVFGPSNFIKNPNAQTNTRDVFTSGGTITRSLTTPLVATTEFNVTTNTSTNNMYWTTRTFDAGTKNQNCEARFTYRGFTTGTTTAQITNNNTTVIAELVLVGSASDPRTVSINFPCGDPSTSKELRLQQSVATLTGVNEIGGIYMGLATNMANVAQAEEVGSIQWAATTNCQWSRTSSSYANYAADADCDDNARTITGNITDASAGQRPAFGATLKPGNYQVVVAGAIGVGGATDNLSFFRLFDGTTQYGPNVQIRFNVIGTHRIPNIIFNFQVTSTVSGTFDIQGQNFTTGFGATDIDARDNPFKISIYRFPSSSELVVTPERQNWYIDGYHGGTSDTNLGVANVSAFTEITNSVLSFVPATGSQPVATLCASGNNPPALSTGTTTCSAGSESVGITFNIPSIGSYEVCTQLSSYSDTSSATLNKSFVLDETSTTSSTRLTTNKSIAHNQFATAATTQPVRLCQFFNFTSLGQKAIRLFYQQAVAGSPANSLIISDNFQDRAIKWTVRPVTNQSNSALYVQGPVKAAETGAVIAEGYQNEWSTRSVTNSSSVTQSSANFSTWYYPWTGELPLPAGNWNICYRVAPRLSQSPSATNVAQIVTRLENKTDSTEVFSNVLWPTIDNNTTVVDSVLTTHFGCQPIAITTSKTFRVGIKWEKLLGTASNVAISLRGDLVKSELFAIRLN